MSSESMLPCFKCGKEFRNVIGDVQNQPYEGTEFRTYGHYGSTFWDSFDGEELVLNICDSCLTEGRDRLAQHKRYLPVDCHRAGVVGQQWVDRPMVEYTGHRDDTRIVIDPEDIGKFVNVEWLDNAEDVKRWLLEK